jgi:hypothetical protein
MKTELLIEKIKEIIRFNSGTLNCSSCDHADKDKWVDDDGICGLVSGINISMQRHDICKRHSHFNGKNIKYDIRHFLSSK